MRPGFDSRFVRLKVPEWTADFRQQEPGRGQNTRYFLCGWWLHRLHFCPANRREYNDNQAIRAMSGNHFKGFILSPDLAVIQAHDNVWNSGDANLF